MFKFIDRLPLWAQPSLNLLFLPFRFRVIVSRRRAYLEEKRNPRIIPTIARQSIQDPLSGRLHCTFHIRCT